MKSGLLRPAFWISGVLACLSFEACLVTGFAFRGEHKAAEKVALVMAMVFVVTCLIVLLSMVNLSKRGNKHGR